MHSKNHMQSGENVCAHFTVVKLNLGYIIISVINGLELNGN